MASRLSRTIATAHIPPCCRRPRRLLLPSPPLSFPAGANQRAVVPRFSTAPPARAPAMAPVETPPPGKHEWLVVVPDKPGTQQKRLEVRPKHFEGLTSLVQSGIIKTGGALLNDKPESEDPSKFDWYGSTLVVVASSKDEVRKLLADDVYGTSGVWDVENAQIWAAKTAFRNP